MQELASDLLEPLLLSCVIGAVLSAVAIWTLDPCVGGVNGDGECCGFDCAGC